jgi:hypothetical protein
LNGTNLDAFLVKFNSGGVRVWASYYGGTDIEVSESIAVDTQENAYLTGFTLSPTGIATTATHQSTQGGGTDAFIARFRSCNIFSFSINATVKDATCYGNTDGIISVTGVNGMQPYLYKLGSVGSFQSTDTFKNLAPGTYTLAAIDDNGCMATVNPVISEPAQIVTPTISGNMTLQQKDTATYSTPMQTGAIYQWSVLGGTIQSGQGTENVLIKWTQAGPAEVKVKVSGSPTSLCPDSAMLNLLVNFPVRLIDTSTRQLRCYPNPVKDLLMIDGLKTTVDFTICNLHGQTMLRGQTPSSIPVKELQTGFYFLHLSSADGQTTVRFLKN